MSNTLSEKGEWNLHELTASRLGWTEEKNQESRKDRKRNEECKREIILRHVVQRAV